MRLDQFNRNFLATLFFMGALNGCAPTSANKDEGRRSRESDEQEAGAKEQESTTKSDDTADIPVPIFLIDPESMQTMVASAGVLSPDKLGPEQIGQGALSPKAAQDTANLDNTVLTNSFGTSLSELVEVMRLIVVEQFGGKTLAVPGGAFVFPVREDLTARSGLLPKLAKVQVIDPAPVDRYRMTLYCGFGLSAGLVRECVKVDFRPSESDRTKGILTMVGWSVPKGATEEYEYALLVDYPADAITGSFRAASASKFDIGIEYLGSAGTAEDNAEILRVVSIRRIAPVLPTLDFINNIIFGRESFLRREVGDVTAYETVASKDKTMTSQVIQRAFLPNTVFAGYADGVLPRSIFEEHSLFFYAKEAFLRNARTPTVNLDCSTSGQILADAYGTDPIPTEVANVPVDICNSATTLDDAVILAGVERFCADEKDADVRIKLSTNTGPFSTLPMSICDLYTMEKTNPRFYDEMFKPTGGEPTPYMLKLKALLDSYLEFMRTKETLGRLETYDILPTAVSIESVK